MSLGLYTKVWKLLKDSESCEKLASYDAELTDASASKLRKAFGLLVKEAASPHLQQAARWAIPTAIAGGGTALTGNHLINKAGDRADESTRQARNRALETGLAMSAMAAALYGGHKLTSHAMRGKELEQDRTHRRGLMSDQLEMRNLDRLTNMQLDRQGAPAVKTSEDTSAEELLDKIAAVGQLDYQLREVLRGDDSAETKKTASEIYTINREAGGRLLRQLLVR